MNPNQFLDLVENDLRKCFASIVTRRVTVTGALAAVALFAGACWAAIPMAWEVDCGNSLPERSEFLRSNLYVLAVSVFAGVWSKDAVVRNGMSWAIIATVTWFGTLVCSSAFVMLADPTIEMESPTNTFTEFILGTSFVFGYYTALGGLLGLSIGCSVSLGKLFCQRASLWFVVTMAIALSLGGVVTSNVTSNALDSAQGQLPFVVVLATAVSISTDPNRRQRQRLATGLKLGLIAGCAWPFAIWVGVLYDVSRRSPDTMSGWFPMDVESRILHWIALGIPSTALAGSAIGCVVPPWLVNCLTRRHAPKLAPDELSRSGSRSG